MASIKTLPIVFFFSFATLNLDIQANGTEFEVRNYCPYTVWAAAVPGGGKRLNQGNTWTISISSGTKQGRIWARTNCNFDSSGRGQCQTGDCNGVLQCMSFGQSPTTLAEYTLDQFANQDFIDISVINGFNVPMEFSSISGQCSRVIRCSGNITKECPNELEVPGGCNGPCMVFNTEKYCCNSGNCEPTSYSKFFKDRCPNAYSYPKDDATSLFTCPTGTNYNVIFCP